MSDKADLIEAALEKVRAGTMSPSEAAELLVSDDEMPNLTTVGEPLSNLINRLGVPPTDVVYQWCQQMAAASEDWYQANESGLPRIDTSQWYLDSAGALVFAGHVYPPTDVDHDDIDPESAASIQQFHDSLLGPSHQVAETSNPKSIQAALPKASESTRDSENDRSPSSNQAGKTDERSNLKPIIVSCLAAASLAAVFAIIYNNSAPSIKTADSKPNRASSRKNASALAMGIDSTNADMQLSTEPIDGTQSSAEFESLDEVSDADSTPTADFSKSNFSLDDLLPALASEGAQADSPEPDLPESSKPPSETGDANVTDDSVPMSNIDPLADDDSEGPDESPQQTRTSQTTSIQLPPVSEVDQPIQVWDHAADSLELEFPYDVPLDLKQAEGARVIRDNRQQAIASISSSDEATAIQWLSSVTPASANMLWHGRLKEQSGDIVYLRPTINADPMTIILDKTDVRPTWNLLAAIPPKLTQFSMDFTLPEDVELGWVEPVNAGGIKRSRALAVLTLKDDESVSLGIRFDVRCSRKLSVRLRFAGRLDSSMPWQAVSRPILEQAADGLTRRVEMISQQVSQMAAIYSKADSGQRRRLRPKRDALDEAAENQRVFLERVTKLQALVAKVESAARLNLNVWVDWPDAQQTLLVTQTAP